jgi:hypothetical protein
VIDLCFDTCIRSQDLSIGWNFVNRWYKFGLASGLPSYAIIIVTLLWCSVFVKLCLDVLALVFQGVCFFISPPFIG